MRLAHLARRAPLQLGDRRLDGGVAVAVEQRREAAFAGRQRRGLRLDVADALVGDADVRQDDRQDLVVDRAALVELDRRQPQTFLLDLGRVGREAARHHAAGVGPVAGVGEPAPRLAGAEERLHELHVHQVRAAEVRVVDDEDVARLERDLQALHALDHRLHRELHRADEHRQAELALRDQLAGRQVVDAVGAVERLGDHRAERAAHEGEVHLVADLLQAVLKHAERDRVD